MKNRFLIFTIAVMLGSQVAAGQFPIRIPKIPKVEKADRDQPKPPEPKTEATITNSPTAARSINSSQPTIVKDSVQVTPYTVSKYRGDFDVWSWTPEIEFSVNGPIASGSQLYFEFMVPGGPSVKFDCSTEEKPQGYVLNVGGCGGPRVPEAQSSLYTGPVGFAIRMRNELAGTDVTLFTGKTKIEKTMSNEHGPKAAKKFVYFVNHDWNLPIGYVYLTPDELKGWDLPGFNIAFWVRGNAYNFKPHMFLNGREIGKKSLEGKEVGQASCESDVDNEPSQSIAESFPQKAMWSRVHCEFPNIMGWDKTGTDYSQRLFGPPYTLAANPGEYEFKLLWNNKLARSIKFTVGPDGKFDNGIAANKLGRDRVIVPVQIIGDQDGPWDRTAWKTEAFYGNPLAGFTWQ